MHSHRVSVRCFAPPSLTTCRSRISAAAILPQRCRHRARSSPRPHPGELEPEDPGPGLARLAHENSQSQQQPPVPTAAEAAVAAASPPPREPPPPVQQQQQQQQQQRQSSLSLLGTLVVVMASAVANRLLYKASLVPLSNYVFFLAQLQTFGYLAVYGVVLAIRRRSGAVTPAMLRIPLSMPKVFLAIGFVEALSALLGFVGASNLPGVVLPLLSQTILLWQVLLAVTYMNKRLSGASVLGVVLVICGVCLAAWPQSGQSPLAGISPFYSSIFVVSMLFPALDTIFKEKVFRQARQQLGQDLDLFVVNTVGSLAQSVFVFLLLPAMTGLRGMSLQDLPGYLAAGWQCFRGLTPSCGSDCSGAPLLPLAYVAFNLVFNVSALELIRRAGNVTMSLTMSMTVPMTILAFTLPLPFLPQSPPLGPLFLLGTFVLLAGLMAYNAPLWLPAAVRWAKQWAAEGKEGPGGKSFLAAAPK